MSRGRDFREPRRRGFDDDFYTPPRGRGQGGPRPFDAPFSAPSGPTVDAVVKWFNPEKGFGFVELSDGSGDAFLHIRALESAGHSTAAPGAKMRVRTGQGQKGPQVTEVLELDMSTAAPQAPRSRPERSGDRFGGGSSGPRHSPLGPPGEEVEGTVKWYNPDKGFGFVSIGDGGKDVFVHASTLRRAGLMDLAEGQRVLLRVAEGMKGREAASIALV